MNDSVFVYYFYTVFAPIGGLESIKASCNWMWPAKVREKVEKDRKEEVEMRKKYEGTSNSQVGECSMFLSFFIVVRCNHYAYMTRSMAPIILLVDHHRAP